MSFRRPERPLEREIEPEPTQSQTSREEEMEAKPRFSLGQVVATPGALEALSQAEQNPIEFLTRHVCGDWGELEEEDKQENELSVEEGFRILSAYTLSDDTRIWIITEADRSATTLLLPSEY
jgi:hypothetical protein